jgi:spore photoproduct lyase
MIYRPKRVYFEKKSLEYPMGERLYKYFNKQQDIEVFIMKGNRVNIPKKTPRQFYVEGKRTIVIRVWKGSKFQSCKPSAHYQLPLLSGCSGKCEYCYLNTRFGDKPYVTIYVNIDDILSRAKEYINERSPEVTYFESSATSDPVPFEPYTGSLAEAIKFFAKEELGRLRFVSKFTEIDSLLNLDHKGHTTIRFSINSYKVIDKYEHGTARLSDRIEASKKVYEHGYPIGFIIGPVILYDNWKKDYLAMLNDIKGKLDFKPDRKIHFEVISHRFTSTAKSKILAVFPETTLPMDEGERKFKYGQFGYGKYVYREEQLKDMKEFFMDNITKLFPNSEIDYII